MRNFFVYHDLLFEVVLSLLKRNGGDDETRTRDLCRDSPRKRIHTEEVVSQPLSLLARSGTARQASALSGKRNGHKN
jgi:hypothetical protein